MLYLSGLSNRAVNELSRSFPVSNLTDRPGPVPAAWARGRVLRQARLVPGQDGPPHQEDRRRPGVRVQCERRRPGHGGHS